MTHEIRYRWKKIQQPSVSLSKHKQSDELITKSCRVDERVKNNIPPMNCSKCRLNLKECSCLGGLGQWWDNLQKKSDSVHERHVSFDSSLIDLERENNPQTKSKQQFVLLDWNNRQSLLNFIRTIKPNKNLSNIPIEQLRELILKNDNIHIFTSTIDLILAMNNEQHHSFYIDPSYYSTIQGTIPMLQSQLIADNIDLTQALLSIQTIANLLGVKIDQFFEEKISRKERKTILHKQSLFIASKIPYYTFRNPSILF